MRSVELFGSLLSRETLAATGVTPIVDEEEIEENEEVDETEVCDIEVCDPNEMETVELDFNSMKEIGESYASQLSSSRAITRENFQVLVLPCPFSQSGLNGDFGSSACGVIALATGTVLCTYDSEDDRDIVKAFVGCIEFGNTVYQESHFLTVQEAVVLMEEYANLVAQEERDCFVGDLQELLVKLISDRTGSIGFVVMVYRNYSVCICKMNHTFYLLDSHSHDQETGASIQGCYRFFNQLFPDFP